MNYRDEMIQKAEYHEAHAARIIEWIKHLDSAGFDWEHVTSAQKWAIENSTTKEVQQ